MERLCTPAALWLTLIMMVIISQDSFIFAFMWHPHTASPHPYSAWSQRPVVYEALSQGCITVGQSGKDDSSNNLTVQVSNQELSWEPFYATIETSQGRVMGTEEWTVIPSHGTLAPRGGADVYTDTCCFHVARHHNSIHDAQPQSCYLVVRTEQDAWAWQLTETENVEENAP